MQLLPVDLVWVVEGVRPYFCTEATVPTSGTVQCEEKQAIRSKHYSSYSTGFYPCAQSVMLAVTGKPPGKRLSGWRVHHLARLG